MSDDELKRWQAGFRGVTQVPEALRVDLDRQARRHRLLGAGLFVVVAGESAVGIALLATDSSPHARAMALFLIGVSVVLGALFLRLRRMASARVALTPDEIVALLDRRLLASKLAARWAPWLASLGALGVALLVVTAEAPIETKISGVAACAVQVAAAWLLPRWLKPRLERRAEMIAQWRRDLVG
ncbi:MAG: hypothetical protein ACJ8AT_35995 [Hyalangium sp.]|uniref:hypothetical protein n=1 Tax=Hyalangium sp. TaxID=2028555 RepID=UPI00389A78B5